MRNIFPILTLLWLQASNISADNERIFKGHYIYGHETNSFRPCDKKEAFWVTGSLNILKQMKKEYAKYTIEPYEEVFAELSGRLTGKAADGFAADYDDQLHVDMIINIRKKTDNDCK